MSECLSVRQPRQLETQVQRSNQRHEVMSAGCSPLMVAEVFHHHVFFYQWLVHRVFELFPLTSRMGMISPFQVFANR